MNKLGTNFNKLGANFQSRGVIWQDRFINNPSALKMMPNGVVNFYFKSLKICDFLMLVARISTMVENIRYDTYFIFNVRR